MRPHTPGEAKPKAERRGRGRGRGVPRGMDDRPPKPVQTRAQSNDPSGDPARDRDGSRPRRLLAAGVSSCPGRGVHHLHVLLVVHVRVLCARL
jgi:hypothetical protein